MTSTEKHLENLSEIRAIMDRSTRFISLSGLSGVFAGIYALVGAAYAYYTLDISALRVEYYLDDLGGRMVEVPFDLLVHILMVAGIVLAASLVTGYFFTARNARKNGHTIWEKSSMQFLVSLLVPLITGGMFCLVLIYYQAYGLVAPTTLIFYGLALTSAGRFSLKEVSYLGLCEICLGLIACFFMGEGLVFWAIGFGVLHIIYGVFMYFKYER